MCPSSRVWQQVLKELRAHSPESSVDLLTRLLKSSLTAHAGINQRARTCQCTNRPFKNTLKSVRYSDTETEHYFQSGPPRQRR